MIIRTHTNYITTYISEEGHANAARNLYPQVRKDNAARTYVQLRYMVGTHIVVPCSMQYRGSPGPGFMHVTRRMHLQGLVARSKIKNESCDPEGLHSNACSTSSDCYIHTKWRCREKKHYQMIGI
jgi:hypothetical protein